MPSRTRTQPEEPFEGHEDKDDEADAEDEVVPNILSLSAR